MQVAGCEMMQDAEYEVRDVGCRIWDVGCSLAGLACSVVTCGLGRWGTGLPCVVLVRRVGF